MASLLEHVCKEFNVNPADIFSKKKENSNIDVLNARGVYIYLLRQKGMTFGEIAKELKNPSRGNVHNEFKIMKDYYENNTYQVKEKIDKIMEQFEHTATSQEILENKDTPEVISVEQSPLSEPVIERNIDTILRPEPKKEASETDFLDDLDDYQAFEAEQDQVQPDTIPEMSFKTAPNDNPDKVTLQMDEETANFSAESILNIVEFGSVEVAYAYASVPEGKMRLLEEEGKVPPHTTEVSKEFNENAREKLEITAKKNIKLLAEPLKKLLKKKNVSVSPEAALIFGALMFVFAMFMATKSLRKDADYFVEKVQKMNTETKKEK